jgi:hypothetical protein
MRSMMETPPQAPPREAAGPLTLVARWTRAGLGLGLIVLSMLPLYRLLDPARAGLAGGATVDHVDAEFASVYYGLLIVAVLFAVGIRYLPASTGSVLARAGRRLAGAHVLTVAGAAAVFAAVATAAFSLLVLDGLTHWIDSIAQVFHARFWAEGMLAGPAHDGGGFWVMQNSLFTDNGWVSQYPPGHVAVLTLFVLIGAPWAAGPFMVGLTVLFGALVADRLLADRLAARAAPVLLAASPFFVFVGATYMNHVTTAALVTVGAYGLLRAWQDRAAWALLAGAAFGLSLATRPLATVSMAAVLFVLIPFTAGRPSLAALAGVAGFTAAGALPFLAALLAYNRHFFGSALSFGYEVALGPQMRLGFLRDPWGNDYGLREAIGYTSSDLMTLGVNLLESPLPAVLLIGVFLLVQRRLAAGERVLLGWALAPVVTNFFYWHHGLLMGPRMLYEAAPAWVLLFAGAACALAARLPERAGGGALSPRRGYIVAVVAAVATGLLLLAPQRALSYSGLRLDAVRTAPPQLDAPSLVFVHGAWTGRIAMSLAANRFRLDTVETLLRQNPTCRVHELARAAAAGNAAAVAGVLSSLDTIPRSTGLPRVVEVSRGNAIRVAEGEMLTPDCAREAQSDRRGIIDAAPLVWLGDVPGGRVRGALYVRDMGPALNARLIAEHPARVPAVYMADDAGTPVLLPYEQGMALLWGGAPNDPQR